MVDKRENHLTECFCDVILTAEQRKRFTNEELRYWDMCSDIAKKYELQKNSKSTLIQKDLFINS